MAYFFLQFVIISCKSLHGLNVKFSPSLPFPKGTTLKVSKAHAYDSYPVGLFISDSILCFCDPPIIDLTATQWAILFSVSK